MIRLGFHNEKDISGYRSLKHIELVNISDNSDIGFRKISESMLITNYPCCLGNSPRSYRSSLHVV
jgi:hypothetical protein